MADVGPPNLADAPARAAGIGGRPCLYPSYYTWMVLLAALDVMFTWIILFMEGRELNPLADFIIKKYNLLGVVMLKLGTLCIVLCICEVVGHRRRAAGDKLVKAVSVILAVPVSTQFVLMMIVLLQSPERRYREMGERIEEQAVIDTEFNRTLARVRRLPAGLALQPANGADASAPPTETAMPRPSGPLPLPAPALPP